MRRTKSRRWTALLVAGATAMLAAGAFASGSSASGSGGVSPAVQAAYNKAIATPTSAGTYGALAKKPAKGLTVDFLACALPTCEQQAVYFGQAVKHLGWTVKTIVFQSSSEGILNAFTEAVTDKPTGGVVTSGFEEASFAKQLAQLKALHIPVVDYFSGDEAGNGIVSAEGDQAILSFADYMSLWITVNSKNKGHVIEFNVPSFPVQAIMQKRNQQDLTGRYCTGCTYKFDDLALTDIGAGLPAKVVAAVQANPGTNYLLFGFTELTAGVAAALKDAGLSSKVKIITAGAEQSTFQGILNGQIAAADAQPLEEQQWCLADELARYHSGTPVHPIACILPTQILTKANVPTAWPVWPGVPNWKAVFLHNWHVS